jgi:exodeoxyribonuclease VII small subunit
MTTNTENLFEQKLSRLQEIVAALEAGDLPLEKGMALYKEGVACSRYCRQRLEKARHEIELWQNAEATPLDMPDTGTEAGEEEV